MIRVFVFTQCERVLRPTHPAALPVDRLLHPIVLQHRSEFRRHVCRLHKLSRDIPEFPRRSTRQSIRPSRRLRRPASAAAIGPAITRLIPAGTASFPLPRSLRAPRRQFHPPRSDSQSVRCVRACLKRKLLGARRVGHEHADVVAGEAAFQERVHRGSAATLLLKSPVTNFALT